MVASVVRYSAVAAKLRAMYSRLLTAEEYEILMNKPRVSDVFLWLKDNSAYSDILQGMNEASVHRGQIERAFSKSLFRDAYKLSLMLPRDDRKMLECVLAKTDIQVVKRVIRSIHTGIPLDLGTVKSVNKNERFGMGFDLTAALLSRSYGELAEVLRPTPLYKVIRPFLEKDTTSTFEMENALDAFYFSMLRRSADTYLRGQDRRITKEFLAAEVDIHNLLRSYRYRQYYAYSGEKMQAHLFPNRYKLSPAFWQELADRDAGDFRELAAKTRYRSLFSEEDDAGWYQAASQYMADLFRRHLRKSPYDFPTVIAYIFLKEIDIQNLITVIEGVRYSLEPQEIRNYLVRIE